MGQTILVTGASSGFGARTARALAARGHRVWAGFRDPSGKGAVAAAELRAWAASTGADVRVVRLDVTRDADVDAALAQILADGGLDVLVSNAGVACGGLTETFSPEVLRAVFEVNVFGLQRMLRAALPGFRARRAGHVIVVSSVLGREVTPFLGPYVASKHAVEGLIEGYRVELAPLGVEVTSVQPGTFPTTSILANLVPPDDPDRAAGYGPMADAPARLFGGIGAMVAQGAAPDPQRVAEAIVAAIEAPPGRRPPHVVVDPQGCGGADRLNREARRIQTGLLAHLGLADLTPDAPVAPDPAELLTAVIEETPLVVYAKDLDLRFVLSNRMHAGLVGRPRAQVLGRTDAELFPADADAIEATSRGVLATGAAIASEYTLPIGDEQRTYHETIFPLRDAAGAIVGLGGIASDVTARRRLEEQLAERAAQLQAANEQLEAMFATIPDLVFTLHEDGTLSCVKADPASDLAMAPDEAEGIHMSDVLGPALTTRFQEAVAAALAGGGVQSVSYTLDVRSGRQDFEARLARQATDRVTTIVRNVTTQNEARRVLEAHRERLRALAQQQAQAEEALRARVAAEVHDGVAQEIAIAKLYVSKVAREVPAAAEALATASEILTGAIRHLNDLIVEVSPPALRTIGLTAALRDAAGRIAASHGLDVELHLDELPRVPREHEVAAYWSVRELMLNVVKHAQARRMVVELALDDGLLEARVLDDGVGIGNVTPSDEGGFGLFGARERLRLIGGDLVLRPRQPGTEAVITLPVPMDLAAK